MDRVLIIAAHPDDEVLGCGGVMRHYSRNGCSVHVCFVTDGTIGRTSVTAEDVRSKERMSEEAAAILGVTSIHRLPFSDMRLDMVAHQDLNNALLDVWKAVQPTVVFVHSSTDVNLDHRRIYDAVEVLARPPIESLRRLYTYEVLSSTEWRLNQSFMPNTFFDVSSYLADKQRAMACYTTELREFPHPRSLQGIEVLAQYRGMQSGYMCAEAFCLVRSWHDI